MTCDHIFTGELFSSGKQSALPQVEPAPEYESGLSESDSSSGSTLSTSSSETESSTGSSRDPIQTNATDTLVASTPPKLEDKVQQLLHRIETSSAGLKSSSGYIPHFVSIQGVDPHTVYALIDDERSFGVRFSFDYESNTIDVPVMSALHELPLHWFNRDFHDSLSEVLKLYDLLVGCSGAIGVELDWGGTISEYQPDCSYRITAPESKPAEAPCIVVENAQSESLPHVRRKACKWLHGSNSQVQVVVILNLVSPKADKTIIEKYEAYLEVWKRVDGDQADNCSSQNRFEYGGVVIENILPDKQDILKSSGVNITFSLRDFVPHRFRSKVSESTFTVETDNLRNKILEAIDMQTEKSKLVGKKGSRQLRASDFVQ